MGEVMTRNQRGIALFISLVLLLVLTIVGVSAVQTTSLEERMARNTHDSVLAFQSAEVALREAEVALDAINSTALFTPAGNNGMWQAPGYGAADLWTLPATWTGANSVELPADTVQGVDQQPRYVIEWLATVQRSENPALLGSSYASLFDRIEVFRITARGIGGSANARVLLQSTYGVIF